MIYCLAEMGDLLFYVSEGAAQAGSRSEIPEGSAFDWWSPSPLRPMPRWDRKPVYLVWWLMHGLHVFRNQGFTVLQLHRNGELLHRSVVTPGYFRFPFMAPEDLQIGFTWTEPAQRGKGLALRAIAEIHERFARPGRRFWYIVEKSNAASIRVIQKAGFRLLGEGAKQPRFGLGIFGAYRPDEAGDRVPS